MNEGVLEGDDGVDTIKKLKEENVDQKEFNGKTCGECDETFTMPARVKRHSRNKHKYLRKTCEICDNTFKKPAWLKKHSRNEH